MRFEKAFVSSQLFNSVIAFIHASLMRRPLLFRGLAPWSSVVVDVAYVIGTILFFLLMLLYVAACESLGRGADVERATKE
jgi:hypothetical protein